MPKWKKINEVKVKVSKKEIALTFCVFFSIFGFIGYLHGRSIRNSPERLRADVLARLELSEIKGRRVLIYRCNNTSPVTWDIDSDNASSELLSPGTDTATLWPAIFQDNAMLNAFLTGGGVASVFTARELISFARSGSGESKFINENHLKLIVAAIFGAISGYEVGYRLAMRAKSDCADTRFNNILNDKTNWRGDDKDWRGWETMYFLICLEQLEQQTPSSFCKSSDPKVRSAEDEKLSVARAEYLDFKRSATLIDHDIVSADFDPLIKYRSALREYNSHCGS